MTKSTSQAITQEETEIQNQEKAPAQTPAQTLASEPVKKERSAYFDNAKFILIILVVVAHGLPLLTNTMFVPVFKFIYIFHMPAFVFIVGYFSARQKKVSVGNLFFQYLIFQVLFSLENFWLANSTLEGFSMSFVRPVWVLWFAMACIAWKILAPLIARLSAPVAMCLVFLIALLAGYDQQIGYTLSLSRIIVFFPFFLLGYFTKKEWVERVQRISPIIGVTILLASFLLVVFFVQPYDRLLQGSVSYAELGLTTWYAAAYRLLTMLWAFILIIAFFVCTPTKRYFFSTFGERTLAVFYLHAFIMLAVWDWPIFLEFINQSLLFSLFFILALIVLTFILASKPVEKIFYFLLYPWTCIKRFARFVKQKIPNNYA